MLFNSYLFILAFLPITLIVYFTLNRFNQFMLGKIWLIVASFVFYGYFNPMYLPIIVISIVLNYFLSQCMLSGAKKWVRTLCYIVGLAGNLGVLGFYKYYDFFVSNVNAAFGTSWVLHHLILPLGISFFTFQQLSYVIDSYQRTVPRYNIIDYALFVTFFPQLIAGPIVLHSEIVPQFENPENRRFNWNNFAPGMYAFALGLCKKVLVADTFAKVAGYGFAPGAALHSPDAFFVVLAFTLQLYFDFSGYCDMALGLGKMFNIYITQNFNSPLKSLNIRELWTRWHMTLSRFFTTYVYFPLGGSRKGLVRTCINLVLVFTVSGLWHGAGWLFLFWGLLNGIMSAIYRIFRKPYDAMHPVLQWLITFIFWCLSLVFFRALTLADAMHILRSLFAMDFAPLAAGITSAFAIPIGLFEGMDATLMMLWFAGAMLCVLGCRNTYELTADFKPTVFNALITIALIFLSVMSLSGVSVFLYYNF